MTGVTVGCGVATGTSVGSGCGVTVGTGVTVGRGVWVGTCARAACTRASIVAATSSPEGPHAIEVSRSTATRNAGESNRIFMIDVRFSLVEVYPAQPAPTLFLAFPCDWLTDFGRTAAPSCLL